MGQPYVKREGLRQSCAVHVPDSLVGKRLDSYLQINDASYIIPLAFQPCLLQTPEVAELMLLFMLLDFVTSCDTGVQGYTSKLFV